MIHTHKYKLLREDEKAYLFFCEKCLDYKVKGRDDVSVEKGGKVVVLDDLTPSEEEDLKQPTYLKKVIKAIRGQD